MRNNNTGDSFVIENGVIGTKVAPNYTSFRVVLDDGNGNVGIGTTSPQSALQVNGEAQVSSSGTACNSNNAGAIRYASNTMYYCNGSAWLPFSASCFGSSSGTDTSLSNGLIDYWNFDENAGVNLHNAVGNGFNGIFQGTVGSQWTSGKINSGLSFNGTDNDVIAANNVNISSGATVSAWFKSSANNALIFLVQRSNPLIYMQIGNTTAGGAANRLNAYFRTNTGNVLVANGNTVVDDNNWHFGTVVRDTNAQQVNIYVMVHSTLRQAIRIQEPSRQAAVNY